MYNIDIWDIWFVISQFNVLQLQRRNLLDVAHSGRMMSVFDAADALVVAGHIRRIIVELAITVHRNVVQAVRDHHAAVAAANHADRRLSHWFLGVHIDTVASVPFVHEVHPADDRQRSKR